MRVTMSNSKLRGRLMIYCVLSFMDRRDHKEFGLGCGTESRVQCPGDESRNLVMQYLSV